MLGFTFLITFLPNSGHSLFISFETLDAHFTTNILDFPEAYFIRISLSKAFFYTAGLFAPSGSDNDFCCYFQKLNLASN